MAPLIDEKSRPFFRADTTYCEPATIKLKLEGEKVTGTFESNHLGTGAIENGIWADHKISFTLKVTQATIKVNGVFKDGKLTGEFEAGQMTGKWEAKKK